MPDDYDPRKAEEARRAYIERAKNAYYEKTKSECSFVNFHYFSNFTTIIPSTHHISTWCTPGAKT